jgi:hypothetical protein
MSEILDLQYCLDVNYENKYERRLWFTLGCWWRLVYVV